MENKQTNSQFEALSPWSEVDSIPPRGVAPRLTSLEGKTIGMFFNTKRSAKPILNFIERKLKGRFPALQFTYYPSSYPSSAEIDSMNKEIFKKWLQGVDAFIAATGD